MKDHGDEGKFPDHVWIGLTDDRPDGSIYEYDPAGIRNDFTTEFMSVAEHQSLLRKAEAELAQLRPFRDNVKQDERTWQQIAFEKDERFAEEREKNAKLVAYLEKIAYTDEGNKILGMSRNGAIAGYEKHLCIARKALAENGADTGGAE